MQYQLGCVAKFLGHVVLQASTFGQTTLLDLRPVKLHSSCIRYSSKHQAPRSGISPHVPEGCVDLKNAVIGHAQARPANVTQLYSKMRWPAPTQTQPALYMQMRVYYAAFVNNSENFQYSTRSRQVDVAPWVKHDL